jgi:hypothetical protein
MKKANFSVTLLLAGLLTLAGVLFEGTEETTAQLAKSTATRAETTYTLMIKDENGAEIGQYFDIRIDSFRVQSDTTVNFQMVPNLGIQDSILQQRHSTFLEMLLRNTGKEAEAVTDISAIIGSFSTLNRNWGPAIDVFIGDEYNGTDDTLRALFSELNSGLGYNYFREVSSPTSKGWNFDLSKVDWRLDRDVRKEIVFNPDGTPNKCTFFIQGLFKYGNDLRGRVRHQIGEALLLNRSYSRELIDTEAYDPKYFRLTRFSPDFNNLLKVGNALANGRDFRYDLNEQNRTPVANAGPDQKDRRVGQLITLDATASLDPDGQIVSYRWQQMFGTKTGTEYMTSIRAVLSDSISPIITFTLQWPGNYRFMLLITDNQGRTSEDFIDVSVYWPLGQNPIEIRGMSLGEYYDPNFSDIDSFFNLLESWDVKSICINPAWFMSSTSSNEIIPLDSLGRDLPNGITIGDNKLKFLIDYAHRQGIRVFLKPMVEFFRWSHNRTDLNPDNWDQWFENYKIFINHYADIAQETSVDLFSVGTELLTTEGFTDRWNDVIREVRIHYSGPITYSSATIYIDNFSDLIKFWNVLDYIGIGYYVHGSGTREIGSGVLDPTIEQMITSFENNFNKNIKPVIDTYSKPVIFTEMGCSNMDGSNQLPWFFNFGTDAKLDNSEQKEYYEAVLRFASGKSWFKGVYVWELNMKWDFTFQNEAIPLTLSPKGKPAAGVIGLWYAE